MEEEKDLQQDVTQGFAHLKFLQLLMNRSVSAKEKEQNEQFLPRDLGVRSSSSSSSRSSFSSKMGDPEIPIKIESVPKKFSQQHSLLNRKNKFSDANLMPKNNNNNESLAEPPRARATLLKQNTMLNTHLGKSILKDIMTNQVIGTKPAHSFNIKPNKEHWRFCIFELGKKQYHMFENKMVANYNMPIDPEDETLIV